VRPHRDLIIAILKGEKPADRPVLDKLTIHGIIIVAFAQHDV
jgi:hypothetical protein